MTLPGVEVEFGLRPLPGEGALKWNFLPSIPKMDARGWGEAFNQTVIMRKRLNQREYMETKEMKTKLQDDLLCDHSVT